MNTEILEELRTLIDEAPPCCVSIFMPTCHGADAAFQNAASLQRLVREAEHRMRLAGCDEVTIRTTLKPARDSDRTDPFWTVQEQGLALFLSHGCFRRHRLPFTVAEAVVVSARPYVRPLLSMLGTDGSFYILGLSRGAARLWEATHHAIQQVVLRNVPTSLAEALNPGGMQPQRPLLPTEPAANGAAHGPVTDQEVDSESLRSFFRQIARGLLASMREAGAPLVLAGADDLQSLYRSVNTYPLLMEKGVVADWEHLSSHALQMQGWQIVSSYFDAPRAKTLAQYPALVGSGRASTRIERILPAAAHGRVAALFVTDSPAQNGRFDAGRGLVDVHSVPQPRDEDLLNCAVVETITHQGGVYLEFQDFMPEGALVAAIFRY